MKVVSRRTELIIELKKSNQQKRKNKTNIRPG